MTCALVFFTGFGAHRFSNQYRRKTANPSSALVLPTAPSTVIKGIKSQEKTIDATNANVNNSETTAFVKGYQLKSNIMSQRIRPLLLENPALGRETNTLSNLGSHSVIGQEAQHQTGTAETYTVRPKDTLLSSTRLPVKDSLLMTEAKVMEKTADSSPHTTKQTQTSLTLKRAKTERAEANIQDSRQPAVPALTTIPALNHANASRLPLRNSRGQVPGAQTSSVKLRIQNSPINSQIGRTKDEIGNQATTQNPPPEPLVGTEASSNKPTPLNKNFPFRPLPHSHTHESQTPNSVATWSMPMLKTPTLATEVALPPKHATFPATDEPRQMSSLGPVDEQLDPHVKSTESEPTSKAPQFSSEVSQSTSTNLPSGTSYHKPLNQTISSRTEGRPRVLQTHTSETLHMYPWSQAPFQTNKPKSQWTQTQIQVTRLFTTLDQKLTLGKHLTPNLSQTIPGTTSRTFASIPTVSPSAFVSAKQLSAAVPVPSSASSRSSKSLAESSVQTFLSTTSKAQTTASLPSVPTPSPISIPPHIARAILPVQSSSIWKPLNSSQSPAHLSISRSPPSSSPLKLNTITSSYESLISPLTIPPSQVSTDSLPPSPSFSSLSFSTSTASSSISSQDSAHSSSSSSSASVFSVTTSHHHRPSPVPHRSHNHHLSSTSPLLASEQSTHKLQMHLTSLQPDPKPNVPTPGILHSPPKVHPNFDPNKAKPNPVHIDTNLQNPSSTPESPVKEGKYPDIIPRNSTWVLGMLLGCSACLGMIAVVGLRYMYRQVCGKRTEVTLNDRERDYGGGERGLIHVQECGDLVRVRRIRDNSFVLLAEYDILASAGD